MIRWGRLVSPCWLRPPLFCDRFDNGNASKGVFATFWPTIISVAFLAGLALIRGSHSTRFHNSSDQNDELMFHSTSFSRILMLIRRWYCRKMSLPRAQMSLSLWYDFFDPSHGMRVTRVTGCCAVDPRFWNGLRPPPAFHIWRRFRVQCWYAIGSFSWFLAVVHWLYGDLKGPKTSQKTP